MNIRGWIDEILAELGEEVKINYFNERRYLPDAIYNPKRNSVTVWVNPPSLVRYGIAHLLAHELAHKVHQDRYGDPGDDFSDTFREVEREMIEKVWEMCRED
jgi:hypothetical protein